MIVTRIPPSPTGHLHIGTARTSLFNYLFAKHNNGKVLFRSEDTDRTRSTKEFETEIIEGLRWLGITCDNEGDIVRQSERAHIYKEYLQKLISENKAYLSEEESKANPGQTVKVVRLRNSNKKITFSDIVRGDITFDTTELGDIVIARSIDDALYHFTVVVDDYLMGITHVIRGDDHISNTPRQILIQEALGVERPAYAHLPLILAPDKSKMSKRHGAVAVREYQEKGYTKEALVNFIAFLGWNPGTDKEIFTLDELIQEFSLEKVQKAGAVFNIDKLDWYNKEYLKQYSDKDFLEYLRLEEADLPDYFDIKSEKIQKLLPVIKERAHYRQGVIDEIRAGEYDFAFIAPEYDKSLLKWKKDDSVEDALPRLEKAKEMLSDADFTASESIKSALWSYAEEVGKGELLWPLRVSLSGKERSPDPFTIAYIVGKEETISRIQTACDKIKG